MLVGRVKGDRAWLREVTCSTRWETLNSNAFNINRFCAQFRALLLEV